MQKSSFGHKSLSQIIVRSSSDSVKSELGSTRRFLLLHARKLVAEADLAFANQRNMDIIGRTTK